MVNHTSKDLVLNRTNGQQSSLNPTMAFNPPNAPAPMPSAARPSLPLPPETTAARKARMNAELISAFKRPCPLDTNPSIKGIGLYTHVEGPAIASPAPLGKDAQLEPEFLPLVNLTGSGALATQMSGERRKVWEELRDAVAEEEVIIGETELGLKELRKRYGGLDAPVSSRGQGKKAVTQQQHTVGSEDGEVTDGATATPGNKNSTTNGRRPSLGPVMASLAVGNGDVAMGGTEPERGRTTEGTGTTPATFYAPDPRKQGR
jgi:hypothetical protein